MVALSELLVLISIAFGFLPKHNSEYTTQKIKYWYENTLRGFWLQFSVEGHQEKQCKTFLAIRRGEKNGKMPEDE